MDNLNVFFNGWDGVLHASLVGGLTYLTIVVYVRVLGKSMLRRISSVGIVVTAALGNGLAAVVVNQSIRWTQAAAGFLTILLAQGAMLWLASRSSRMRMALEGSPMLIFYEGEFLEPLMHKHGLSRAEVCAGVRQTGESDLEAIGAIVYEIDGSLTIVPRAEDGIYPTLDQVRHYPPETADRKEGTR